MDTILFTEAEVAEPSDFDAIGAHARAGQDAIVGGAIDYAHHWADIGVSTATAIALSLSGGSLFVEDVVYTNADAVTVDLQAHLPLVTGDARWVALLLRGVEATATENRMVETDADTGATVQMAVPKISTRRWEVTIQQGLSSPTPIRPTVAATECCLAYVELATTGIVSVEMNQADRVKTLAEVEGRVTVLEGDMASAVRRVSSIETDIANIAVRLKDVPNPIVVRQMQRDLAQLRRTVAMPAEARAYWYDAGLLKDEWATTDASWLARVREGVRFAWAAERDMQLALVDASSSAIRSAGTLLMPAWDETVRLSVDGDGGSKNISQLTHTVTTATLKSLSRTVTEAGASTLVCENAAEWAFIRNLAVGELFTVNGETFRNLGYANTFGPGHNVYAIQHLIVRTYDETYWEYETEEIGVNGSIYGQTWLCAQPMVLTSLDLSFTRVGSDGDVHLFICECDESGQPQFGQVLAAVTKAVADLATGWVTFDLTPTLLESGTRYAWFTVTTGNHALETVSGNKYAQGSLFWATDGAWAQGDVETDFAMRLKGAKFVATRTAVEFSPATLENGMTDLRFIHAGWAPGGTALTWEIFSDGGDGWQPLTLTSGDTSWLAGLPALTRIRAVFTGTTDLQPAMRLDATARVMTFRPRGDFRAVSVDHDFGVSTTTVRIDVTLDRWDDAKHTVAPKVVVGATVVAPSAVVVTPDLTNEKKRVVSASFTVPSTTSARARVDMATTEVTDVPFVQDIAMYAL